MKGVLSIQSWLRPLGWERILRRPHQGYMEGGGMPYCQGTWAPRQGTGIVLITSIEALPGTPGPRDSGTPGPREIRSLLSMRSSRFSALPKPWGSENWLQ